MRNPLRALATTESRSISPLPFNEWLSYFTGDGFYPRTTMATKQDDIDGGFSGLVEGAYKRNGIVFACMLARQLLFSEARFQFQEMRQGRPGDLFGTADLAILERPWPGATTGDLLSRAMQDIDLAGNFFATRRGEALRRLRPDWMSIILGSRDGALDSWDIDAEVIGFLYHPGGRYSGRDVVPLLREQVAHFAPIPDPMAAYRGMSWLTPIIREVMADSAARDHKLMFFENGATPNLVVSLDIDDIDEFKRWMEAFDTEHKGVTNAYKTLYLGAASTATVVGNSLQQMDFKTVQGAGEVRIASAAGIHPVIVGLSEGLQGSSLNSGNFTAARRLTADKTLRPLWRNLAGSLETIIPAPPGSRLWYDDRDIPFLADDVKDAAEVQAQQAQAIRQLVDAGFEAQTVVDAIVAGDFKRLTHSGLMSVQLLPPGTVAKPPEPAPIPAPASQNGRAMHDLMQLALAQRQTPTTINFPEGFVRSETTVEPAKVTIEQGAVQVPITVEPANVTIERGAVQVDAPVTVEPAQLTIEEGAIRSETPVTVNTPDVTIEEGAVRVESPVTVEPANVTVNAPEPRKVKRSLNRDAQGRITGVTEE